ncbi:MAG: ABC transporter substrate-binding protein [Pseudomonadota bacterium]
MKNFLFIITLLFSTTLTAEPECPRIISQSPYITKSLQWLGLEACIVGVSRYDTLERPYTGGVLDPDADLIATLEPDLLFTSDWTPEDRLAAITPEGTRSFRLKGFGSMAEIETNLRLIGREAGIDDIEQRVTAFHREWTQLAGKVNGNGKKVLLLSACSGMPYSFGRQRWLSDLFARAGFVNVETVEKLRHITPGEEVTTLNALINALEPELLFIFERKENAQCAFIKPKTPLRIINLDGDKFLHPAPVLLEGLAELQRHNAHWSH